MITCAEAVTQLWEYIERALPAEQEERVDEHIAVCRQCCGEAEFAGQLRTFLDAHAEDRIPDEARERLEVFLTQLDTRQGGAT